MPRQLPQPGLPRGALQRHGARARRHRAGSDKPDSRLGRAYADDGRVSGREVVAAAQEGDADALALFERLGRNLGVGHRGDGQRLRARAARDRRRALARGRPVLRDRARGGRARARCRSCSSGSRSAWREAGADAGVIGAGLLGAQELARSGDTARDDDRPRELEMTTTETTRRDARRALHQHDPHALDGRACRRRTPATRARRWRWRPVAYLLYTRVMKHNPAEPGLVRPRPLRALGRPRVDAALLDPAPVRLRAHARRPQELPPARQPDGRPPRVRADARPGSRPPPGRSARASRNAVGLALAERDAGRALQPRRPRADRPLHLHDRQRRRHPGGRGRRRPARSPATSASAS